MSHRFVLWTVLVAVCGVAAANKPVFDLSNSMRLVLLPADTPVGSVIYKLRASDADDEYPLAFREVNFCVAIVCDCANSTAKKLKIPF